MTRRAACALVLVVLAAAGCAHERDEAAVRVEPSDSRADEPVRISVSGVAANARVTLVLRSTDAAGVPWRSSATFRADDAGALDVSRAPATGGGYRGTSAMGLVWSLQPDEVRGEGRYAWPEGTRWATFALTAVARGEQLAETSFRRRLLPERLERTEALLRRDGFVGVLLAPANDARAPRPAVVVLGGSEGGTPLGPRVYGLAGRGYAVLALAYFGEPGLPTRLFEVPLEYVARAIRWLAARPGVDPGRVVVWGSSRGSEAALLVGAHYPRLVRAVVATVPSSVALCAFPGCDAAAWTLGGRALPYTREFNSPRPSDEPAAVVPVERIRGPVLAVCGGLDAVWDSCAYARAIMSRLRARGHARADRLYAYPRAGHALVSLMPYQPDVEVLPGEQRARADAWPRLLEFLDAL